MMRVKYGHSPGAGADELVCQGWYLSGPEIFPYLFVEKRD